MPIKKVRRKGRDGVLRLIGYRWGSKGKIYLIRSFTKKGAYKKALTQGKAIKTNHKND